MAKRKKAKVKPSTKSPKPDGSVSSGVYDAVETLVADGTVKRSEAFRRIAKETGRKEGTVAVNYYYAAKKRGTKPTKNRKPARRTMTHAVRNGRGHASRASALLKSLADLLRAQAAEIQQLRRDGARYAEIRRLIG